MKHKIFLAIIAIALICVLLISCTDIVPQESSVPPNTDEPSLPDLSFPDESIDINVPNGDDISDADISNVETNYLYVWIDEEEMDRRFAEFKAGGEGSELNTKKYLWYFYQIDSVLQDYITINKFEDYLALFSKTVDITTASICEYYDISKQEYIDLYTERLREKGDVVMAGNYDFYRYDAIFSEEYWNHPDYLLSDYVPPEIDDYYTSLEDRNGYTRRYYIIDRLLIEFVGVDAFEDWLESVGDVRQNIVEFTEYFDITREVYDEVYRDTRIKPYNPDYLFGTPEEQEIYFTVHPLN